MRILYNPQKGAPIKNFIYEGEVLSSHYPDGHTYRNSDGEEIASNGFMQYEDDAAETILNIYGFLQEMSVKEVASMLPQTEEPESDGEFNADDLIERKDDGMWGCTQCEFNSKVKVALYGHVRTHKNESVTEGEERELPILSAHGGQKVTPLTGAQSVSEDREIENGVDKDGVEWYGPGAQVKRPNQTFGKADRSYGHFKG